MFSPGTVPKHMETDSRIIIMWSSRDYSSEIVTVISIIDWYILSDLFEKSIIHDKMPSYEKTAYKICSIYSIEYYILH